MGTAVPFGAVWVRSRHRVAVKVTSGAVVSSNEPVYVIVIIGHFTDSTASVPAGRRFPTGSVASFVIDVHTLRLVDAGVANHLPKLTTSGTVHDLLPFVRALTRKRDRGHP